MHKSPATRQVRASILLAALLMHTAWPSFARADQTWTAGSAADLLWSSATNWTSAIPLSTDNVLFDTTIPNPGSLSNPNIITLGSGSVANGLSFKNGYTLSSGDLTLTSGAVRVDLGNTAIINSQLLGTGGLNVSGGGTLRLTNSSNSFTGTTTLDGGGLVISNAGQLGGDTSAISILSGNTVVAATSSAGYVGGSLVLEGQTSPVTITRAISATGQGSNGRGAAITTVGSNTISGLVTTAVASRNTRLTSVNGTMTLSGGLATTGTSATTFTTLGGVNSTGSGNFNLSGPLTGSGSIEKGGAGTLFLNPSAATGFTGTVRISASNTVNQSTVRVSSATAFGANTAAGNTAVVDLNGGVLEIRSDSSLNFGKNVYQRANSSMFTGPAAGGSGVNGTSTFGVLHAASNTTLTFNSRNGYGVTMTGATTQENSNNSLNWTNNMGGTLLFTAGVWPNNDATTARTLTFAGNGNTTVTGSILATGAGVKTIAKTGTGLLTIIGNAAGAGVNGPTTIQGSLAATDFRSISDTNASTQTITLGNTSTTPGNLIIGTSGTSVAANLTSSRPIVFNGTTNNNAIYANQTLASPVVLNGAITKPIATTANIVLGGTSTQENIITTAIPATGTGGLTKNGAGLWALSGANLYVGPTTITRGTLRLKATAGASDIIPAAATNTIVFNADAVTGDAGGTLELSGFAATATTEALGALTPTAGAGTVKLTGSGAAANLTFTSLGAVGKGAGVNIDSSAAATGTVTLTGVATSTATTLPGNGHIYIDGADFARSNGGVLVAPVYGTDVGFVNAAAGAATLTAASHNAVTGAITAQTAITVSSLKTTTSNLTLAGLLTVNTGAATNDGGILAAGSSTIAGTGITTGGTGTLVFRTNATANVLTLNAPMTSTTTGGFTKNGAGVLVLGGANAQSGTTTINEGIVRLATGGVLGGTGASATDLVIRQGATLDLNGIGSAATIRSVNGSGTISNGTTGTPAASTVVVGNNNGTGTFTGIFANGTGGALSVSKIGTGGMSWLGSSTYTGVTNIGSTGLVTVDTMANGGTASGIGASTSAASNLVFSGSTGGLVYAGGLLNGSLAVGSRSATTDRLFTLSGTGATLSSTASNNNAIVWSNTGAIVHGIVGPQALVFTGTAAADNTFNPQLTDSGTGANITSVSKTGAGQWNFGNSNNTYTGATTVVDGILGLNNSGALPVNSPLSLGSGTTIGLLQATGTFARNLTATPAAGTGTITFGGTAGGGFAAHADKLTVTLNGGSAVTWASGGFIATGATLALNSASSLGEVEFTNAIDLGGAARTITVNDNANTGSDIATMSGALSNGSVVKAGVGQLQLTGASTYLGTTSVNAGGLTVRSLGSSTSPAATPTSVGLSGTGTTFDNTNAVVLGTGTTGGVLQYTGTGETSDRKIRLNSTGATQIHADGSGALILAAVANDMLAGAKALNLRGSNTAGNMITSQLSDNTGALNVVVDGSATWILTNSANNYTGGTAVNAGALGIGSNTALGTGTLTINNGNLFAFGGDRVVANAVTQSANVTTGFIGDYSLTLANVTAASTNNNLTTVNNIVAGKSLTTGAWTFNSLTGAQTWTIDGSGETNLGDITTTVTGAFGMGIAKTGDGTLTLGGAGGVNNYNRAGRTVDIDRGTLRLGANEVIGNGLDNQTTPAAYGGVTLTPELSSTDTAIFDLNGKTETINALTATTDGVAIINNSSASPATLSFGGADTTVAFGTGGTGTYSITQTGGGAINLTKIGTGTANFTGTLGNTGTLTSSGGTFNLNSPVLATGVASNGGVLNLKGGFTTPGNLLTVSTDSGGVVSFANGAGTPFNNLTSLNLSLTANAGLELDVGDTAIDKLTTAAASVGNVTTLFIKDIDITGGMTYDLISNPAGGLGVAGNYALNLPGYSGSSLTVTPTLVQLNAGTLITSDVYWNNGTGIGGTLTSAWNTVDPTTTNINFSGVVGGTPALQLSENLPGKGQKVIFQADNLTGGAPLATTLEQSFTINTLEFRQSTTAADTSRTISIAPGAVSSNSLTLKPSMATDGINLQTGAVGTVTISAPFVAGTAQTWTVADAPVELTAGVTTLTTPTIVDVASTTGLRPGMTITGTGIPAGATIVSVNSATQVTISAAATAAGTNLNILAAQQLNMTGLLSGAGNVVKAGAGKVVLSAANGALTGTYTTTGGITQVNTLSALGGVAGSPGSGVDITLTGGSFYYNNGTAGTFVNDITLNGGTLAGGGQNHTYSGSVAVTGNSMVSLRDQAAATATFGVARNVTLSGVVSGSSAITVDGNSTASAGNQVGGALILNNAANTWSGGLNFNRGTATITSAASPSFTANNVTFNNFGRLQLQGNDGTTLTRTGTLNFAGGALGEVAVDNTTATITANYTVNQSGAVTLGSGGTGGTARFFIADVQSNLTLTGGVTLGGNSSISVTGGDADSLVTISGTGISDGGSGYSLAINDEAGAWAVTSSRLAINAASTYSGGTTLNEGILILGHKDALGTGGLTITGASTLMSNTNLSGATAVATPTTVNAALTIGGANNLELSNSVAGTSTLTVTNTAITTLSGLSAVAANNYAGLTTVNAGTLAYKTNSPTMTAGLTLGAAAANTVPVAVDLDGVSATFGGALIMNINSATPSTITVDAGQSLTVNNNVQIGATAPAVAGTVTSLALNGGGAFNVTTAAAGSFVVGGSTSTTNGQDTTLDLTGLGSATINTSTTGTLRVNPAGATNLNGAKAKLLLPAPVVADTVATTTITAGTIAVGNASLFNSNAGQVNNMTLGTGLTTLNADTINVGTGARDIGEVIFGQAGGDLIIRAADGTSRATAINIGTGGATTGTGNAAANNLVDFSNHDADILVTTLNVGNQARVANLISEFNFGAGDASLASKLDATNVNIGFRTGTGTTTLALTNRVNLSGGAVIFGNVGGTGTGVNIGNSSYSAAGAASTIGELNISGGTVTIHNSTSLGAAVRLGTNVTAGGGTVTASMNLTGGSTTLGGHILRNATSPRTTSTVLLNGAGAILDMGGFNIGATGSVITLDARQGTLKNLGELNGGGNLTKTTSGTLILDGTNTYTGTTQINGGTVELAGGSAILDTGAVALADVAGANLQLNANETIGSLSGGGATGGNVNLQGNTLTLSAGSTTFAGIISGSGGSLVKGGAGTQVLSGVNTFSGKTTIANGTLSVATVDAATAAQPLGTNSDLDLGVVGTSSGKLNYTGAAATFGKNINALGNGTDTVQNSGSGLLTLSGTITKNGTTLYSVGGGSGILVTGSIVGAAAGSDLVITGGTTTLAAANTYNGPTFLEATGVLAINHANAISTGALNINGGTLDNTSGAAITVATNNPLNINADFTFTGSNNLNLGTGAVTLNANRVVTVNGAILTIGGVISGAHNLTGTGAGTLKLTGASTYTGTTTAQSGNTISVGGNGALGDVSAGTTINSGAALSLDNVNYTDAEPLQLSGTGIGGAGALVGSGTSSFAGPITFGSDSTIAATSGSTLNLGGTINKSNTVLTLGGGGNINVNNVISGDGVGFNDDLVVNAGTTVTLNAVNTYTGPTYVYGGGTLRNGINDALPNSSVVGNAGSTTLQLGHASDGAVNNVYDLMGYHQTIATLISVAAGGNTNTITNGGTADSILSVTAGSFGGLLKDGATNKLSLVKQGTGTLELSGANTYSGGTTISGGTLSILNTTGSATGSGNVTVANGAVLAGTGKIAGGTDKVVTINGALTIGNPATIPAVASTMDISTTGASGSTVFGASSILNVDLISGAGTAATGTSDMLRLFGVVTIDPAATLAVGNPLGLTGWVVGDNWQIIDWTAVTSLTGTWGTVDYSSLGLSGLALNTANLYTTGFVSIMAIPEPSRALLLALGLFGILVRRRRR